MVGNYRSDDLDLMQILVHPYKHEFRTNPQHAQKGQAAYIALRVSLAPSFHFFPFFVT